ncbi:MAG: CoA-substrate-specific enzyme activase, partial [Clostridiales bacterium]|nr:CoA-substrate-specific enzyme activase [Clostridiales bacterium]
MKKLGIDIGTSTVKLVLMQDGKIEKKIVLRHYGKLLATLRACSEEAGLSNEGTVMAMVTGANSHALIAAFPSIDRLGNIPAIVEGVKALVPDAGSIIDIGSQGSRYITRLRQTAPDFSENEHCAGGTGAFFEDQMSRLGLRIENYSDMAALARSVPRLSGRCAVFAKTDIIHRQQEGVSTPDILLGLCYAMIRNYKAAIVKNLPVEKPVVFVGGVTQNTGAVQAVRDVFRLSDRELIIPDNALYLSALGCARKAEHPVDCAQMLAAMETRGGTSAAGT